MTKIELEIFKKAVARFEELTGQVAKAIIEVKLRKDRFAEAIILFPKLNARIYAEIKPYVTNQTLGAILYQIKETNHSVKSILITQYVTPQLADRLKESETQFMDVEGNAYLNLPNMFYFIKGNKKKENIGKEKSIRAFQPAGLKLIYALLCNPGLEEKPYRVMADVSNISNGAVTWAIRDLKKLGFILDMGKKGMRLIKKKELLQRWVNLYAELLRPKLFLGKYKADNIDWWKNQNLLNAESLFGGETAAAHLTKYLKPQNHTIYTEENYGKLLLQLKLKNDRNGNIEVLKKFWNFDDKREKNNLVNPMLIYADLLATGDIRNIETAQLIYNNEIIRYIRED